MHEESVMLIVNQIGGGRVQTGTQGLGEEHVGRHWW